jgi:geranylgeranyl pyrophosphate synthase
MSPRPRLTVAPPTRTIHGSTEPDGRGASRRRSDEGGGSLPATEERRAEAPHIGRQATEARDGSGLERVLEATLAELLSGDGAAVGPEVWEAALFGPARDFLSRGGKSTRARLVEAGWRIGDGGGPCPPLLPALLEVLHAGSLVVDDIEDDSTHRRGVPALHRRYGVPRALNCGSWMTFLPSLLLEWIGLAPAIELELRRALARAVLRCHHGQALDVSVQVHATPRAALPGLVLTISRLKTGALTELALTAGAIAAGAPPATAMALAEFGADAGVALQMLDDLASLDGAHDVHKRHEDLRLGRATWPWAWLARDADARAFAELARRATFVALADDDPEPLAAALRRRVGEPGRDRARARLGCALERLRAVVGPAAELLAGVVHRLEESHG